MRFSHIDLELRRADDQGMPALAKGVLLDERETDFGFPRADAIGVDNPVMPFQDGASPRVAVTLEGRERQVRLSRRWCWRDVEEFIAVQFQERTQIDVFRSYRRGRREEKPAQVIGVGGGHIPQLVEPRESAPRRGGLVGEKT